MTEQLSNCCKATINLDSKLKRPECYTCSKCGRVIGSPMTPDKRVEEIVEDVLEFEDKTYEATKAVLKSEHDRLREIALDDLRLDLRLTLTQYHQDLMGEVVEDKQKLLNHHNILTVGWHKGEMDFGVNCSIDELDIKQMHEFRVMTCVAIGQAENMWRKAREKFNPTAQTIIKSK